MNSESPNLKSCLDHPNIVTQKLQTDIHIEGPFSRLPLPNLRISPTGLVPQKSEGEFRLIQHLSYPSGSSVNDYIDKNFASVNYASFDDAVHKLLPLGQGALFAKTDIESAFRLIPIHPSDHDLLGFKFQGLYYYDSCLSMGASSSCAIFERFSSALEFIALQKLGIKDVVQILNDFLNLGPANSKICQNIL